MRREAVHNFREHIAGCRMPSAATIEIRDVERRQSAERGSRALLGSLLRYGSRHGLPNLSADWCAEQLRPLVPIERPRIVEPRVFERRYWSQEEDEKILKLRAEHWNCNAIAHSLEDRTESAVASRLRCLDRKGRR